MNASENLIAVVVLSEERYAEEPVAEFVRECERSAKIGLRRLCIGRVDADLSSQ
jgi:hypothetical protein